MTKKINSPSMDFLFDSILKLKTRDECYKFFDDLCTVKELSTMAQRIEVAGMLRRNCTYVEISEKTGASTVTISRVNRILNYGNNSLNDVLEQMERQNDKKNV